MTKLDRLTQEQKEAIIADYNNYDLRAHDVCAKWKLDTATMTQLVYEMGAELRNPNKAGKRTKGTIKKRCPNCHRTIDLKGARFCPYCGADIRDEKELLIERIEKLFSMLTEMSKNSRDEAQAILIDTINYIKKG